MYLCTHATQHTPHGPHTVSSIFSHLLSSLCLSFSVLLSPCDVVCDVVHTVSIFSLLSSLVLALSPFLCPLSPCDVVCDVVLCCVCGSACGVCGVVCGVVLLVVVVCVWCGLGLVCPTWSSHLFQRGSPKKPLNLIHFKFENKSNTACSRFLPSSALPDEKLFNSSLNEKNMQKNQLLHGSICLSPQETECNERFAGQHRCELPLEILLPFSRCDHHLSGPHTCALTQNHFQDHGKYTYMLLS